MKAIILSGGSGTRLYPSTLVISKQLLPIYNKPMIYYPLSTIMLAGIREILIITDTQSMPLYKQLLKDGSQYGLSIEYAVQDKPSGIAEAFMIGEDFIDQSNICLILGDNIFYAQGMINQLNEARVRAERNNFGAMVFGYHVQDPERYGVVEIEQDRSDTSKTRILSIEEKPTTPKSNYALTGLYFFDNSVVSRSKKIEFSARGELEITSVIQSYLNEEKCEIEILKRGFAWLDTGTHESMLDASNFIAAIEKRQGYKIACLEEIAYNCGYIDKDQAVKLAKNLEKSGYGEYIQNL